MKSPTPKSLVITASLQFLLATLIALSCGVAWFLHVSHLKVSTSYVREFEKLPVRAEATERRGPFNFTPQKFARLVQSSAEQLSTPSSVAFLASVAFTVLAGFHLDRSRRAAKISEDAKRAP